MKWKGTGSVGKRQVIVLKRVVREGLTEKVTLEQRPAGASPTDICGESVPDRKNKHGGLTGDCRNLTFTLRETASGRE